MRVDETKIKNLLNEYFEEEISAYYVVAVSDRESLMLGEGMSDDLVEAFANAITDNKDVKKVLERAIEIANIATALFDATSKEEAPECLLNTELFKDLPQEKQELLVSILKRLLGH